MEETCSVADRQDLFRHLADLDISVSTKEHPPVFTVDEARALRGAIPGGHCKNLFLKDKKGAVWLVVALEDTVIDLKALPALIGSARLSFGSAELMGRLLGVKPGSVTPFALINDRGCEVNVVLDAKMMAFELLNYHPLSNDATTTIRSGDLLRFIRSCGHHPRIVALD